MSKPVVLLDVDGVIANFSETYHAFAEKVTGRTLPGPDKWTVWDMQECLDLSEQETRYVFIFMNRDGVAQKLRPYLGAISGVYELARVCDLYFLTSPIETSPTWVHDRTMWLVSNFGLAQGRKVIHTHYKPLVQGDFFIDDRPSNVELWGEANPDGRALVWDQNFNRGPEASGLDRVNAWSAVQLMVEEYR